MSNAEKRRAPRLERVFPVQILEHQGREVHALDVSWLGIRVVVDQQLEQRPYTMVLEVDPSARFVVEARPVWSQRMTRAGKQVVGLTLDPDQTEELKAWVEEQLAA